MTRIKFETWHVDLAFGILAVTIFSVDMALIYENDQRAQVAFAQQGLDQMLKDSTSFANRAKDDPTPPSSRKHVKTITTSFAQFVDANREPDESIMLDSLSLQHQPVCDGDVWEFNSDGPGTFSLGDGDRQTGEISGSYHFDGSTLYFRNVIRHSTSNAPTSPMSSNEARVIKLADGRVSFANKTYRVCAPS